MCVGQFSGTARCRRQTLFHALEEFVQKLLVARIRCDVFLDGSFVTKKEHPEDVDVIVSTEHAAHRLLDDDQLRVLEAVNGDFVVCVDSCALTTYPRGHDRCGTALDLGNAGESYGLEHGQEWLKGYVVIRLWETDVGNRICR